MTPLQKFMAKSRVMAADVVDHLRNARDPKVLAMPEETLRKLSGIRPAELKGFSNAAHAYGGDDNGDLTAMWLKDTSDHSRNRSWLDHLLKHGRVDK